MAIYLDSGKNVISMSLVEFSAGNEMLLFERQGSHCYFSEDIFCDKYIITLRVDWGDIRNSDPVLDADIYKNKDGRRGGKLKNGAWHHTLKNKSTTEGLMMYEFSFEDIQLKLIAKTTFSMCCGMDAVLVKAV